MSNNGDRMTVLCGELGFILIPYPMRPGQAPRDILPEYRQSWLHLPRGHSAIPGEVAWAVGTFDEIAAVDLDAVRAESEGLRAQEDLDQRRRDLAEKLSGALWLECEALACQVACSARLTGKAELVGPRWSYVLARDAGGFSVCSDAVEVHRERDAMGAARWIIRDAIDPAKARAARNEVCASVRTA